MSLVDVSELMTDPDFVETVTLRRPTIHFANEGEAISSYEDTSFVASVQPAKAEEIAALPEGERGSGQVYRIYTATELRMSDGKTDVSDVLVYGGKELRVIGQEPWGANGYFKFLAVEVVPS